MTDIISYRLSATGMWGYSYYLGSEKIGETTCQISTSSTVRVTGEDIAWYQVLEGEFLLVVILGIFAFCIHIVVSFVWYFKDKLQ